ncbi:MAG: guanylate kinase [Psychrosphaera sp.]|nr:guanylate kinase [Psychrosphaera sp.]
MKQKRGNLFILSAPSGAGKSSLISALIERNNDMQVSVSHTTRNARPGEQNGVHYHFVSVDEFKTHINEGHFVEWAEVFGNFYGTSKVVIENLLNNGVDVFLDIDWQGAQQIRELFPEVITVFIAPPSRAALRQRLIGRGQDESEVIERRMIEAKSQISHYPEFDFIIVNDDFEQCLSELKLITRAQRLKATNQAIKFDHLLKELLAND